MRFLETCVSIFINIDAIKLIDHEMNSTYPKDIVHSYIYDFQGNKYDFFDVPNQLIDKKNIRHEFQCEHLISLHRHAAKLISSFEGKFLSYDEIEDQSWELFINEFNSLLYPECMNAK